jgi:hypothetical protein
MKLNKVLRAFICVRLSIHTIFGPDAEYRGHARIWRRPDRDNEPSCNPAMRWEMGAAKPLSRRGGDSV